MKTCKKCGAQLEDQAKFCRYCGKPTEAEPAQDAGASYGQSAGSQDTGNMYGSQNTGNMYGGQNTGGMYGNQNTGNMYGQNAGGTYGGQNTGNMYGGQNAGYGGYQNPGYGYGGYQQPAPAAKASGASVGALVLGLVGIVTGYFAAACMAAGAIISSYNMIAFLLFLPNILGIVLGIAGIMQAGKPGVGGRGMAIAGLVLGIIFFAIWLIVGMLAVSEMDAIGGYYGIW